MWNIYVYISFIAIRKIRLMTDKNCIPPHLHIFLYIKLVFLFYFSFMKSIFVSLFFIVTSLMSLPFLLILSKKIILTE